MHSNMGNVKVVVIGGGAAGFFGAITCAESNPKCRVTLLEKGAHVLTKVRISGGGRCNVTHACFDPKTLVKNYPRGGQALLGPFHKFQPRDTMAWFENRGVPLKTEDDGRVFPVSDMSYSIIQALKDAAKAAGVTVRTQAGPVAIEAEGPNRFRLELPQGEKLECDRLLIATGGTPQGYDWARSLGHSIESPVPSLFTFGIPDKRLEGLAGISVESAKLKIAGTDIQQSGPLLITHWGFSGPAALKLSAWGARVLSDLKYHAQIEVNWLGLAADIVLKRLTEFKQGNPRKAVSSGGPFGVPHRLWERLVGSSGFPSTHRWADVSKNNMNQLLSILTSDNYAMRSKSAFKEEFVTCGGVCLDEVNFQTMESKVKPGLHFAGEILDIDGVTGGFNFQNAWTTGWLAGKAIAR